MAKRTRKSNEPRFELIAPVVHRAEAARVADVSGLPETVWEVFGPDGCHWWEVALVDFDQSGKVSVGNLQVAGIVTYLPSNYFSCPCTEPKRYDFAPCSVHHRHVA